MIPAPATIAEAIPEANNVFGNELGHQIPLTPMLIVNIINQEIRNVHDTLSPPEPQSIRGLKILPKNTTFALGVKIRVPHQLKKPHKVGSGQLCGASCCY